ncbi:uncharacterized protein LOC118752561, partial [Rhagoletis pomonella]|uniref:uncharacterized protein LOC118752561 n=1 Tax=Rhagoletis pomonella TaxID=28610 RepID=UPI00177C1671
MIEICASVVPIICADVLPEPRFEGQSFMHLQAKLTENRISSENLIGGINLLIGQDNYWKFHLGTNDNIGENLMAVDTFFGWTIQGCCGYNENSKCALSIIENREEQVDVTKFWDLEAIGIAVYNENASAVHDVKIEKIGMRYSLSLPWKIPKETLHNNKSNALNHLRGLTIKLMKNREKLIEYDCGIRELLNAGIAERVLANHNDQIAYYMPHRPVYREDKTTTKMRIVFDASSSENDLASLNDHLSPVADIEKAFLQISIDEADRDTHRFLWYETLPESFSKLPPVVELRMSRVTFGVTSSPFLLAATIQTHLKFNKPNYGKICDTLQKSFYVDDLVTRVKSSQDAELLFRGAMTIMKAGGFNLRSSLGEECQPPLYRTMPRRLRELI